MTDLKLCRDCRFLAGDYCNHENTRKTDYVNGNHSYYPAQIERTFLTAIGCGPNARNFEPKEA